MKTMSTQLATIIHSVMTPLRWRRISLFASIVIVLFTTFVAAAPAVASIQRTEPDPTYKGHANTYKTPTPPPAPTGSKPGPKPSVAGKTLTSAATRIQHSFTPSMKQMVIPLVKSATATQAAAAQGADATSSDGTLEVKVPATALNAADVANPNGPRQLVVAEIAPPGGSTDAAQGSGIISFGTYLLQVQNSQGKELNASTGLRQNISLIYHASTKKSSAIPLDHVVVNLNGPTPITLPMAVAHQGAYSNLTTTYSASANTVTASVPLASPSASASFDTSAPEGYFGKPDVFQNSLHTGDLTDTINFDLPTGPGGLTPPLHLSYSSAAVSATHNVQGAAPWVGDGWNLDLGEITWSETNATSCPNCTATWESTWSLSDPFGTSAELIPPNTKISTYYDDTPNNPAPGAVTWHTAPESHAKVISYVNPTVDCTNFPQTNVCGHGGYGQQPPCFRVFLTNGIMEEFGCTTDSRQWYVSGTTNYVTAWKLDLIIDPTDFGKRKYKVVR